MSGLLCILIIYIKSVDDDDHLNAYESFKSFGLYYGLSSEPDLGLY